MIRFAAEAAAGVSDAVRQNIEAAQSAKGVLLISALGLAVVFVVLILLMGTIKLMGLFDKRDKKKTEKAADATAVEVKEAVGFCGEVKLFDVPDRTAAMLMAITADKLGEPLNTLRFISMKEVK